MSETLPLLPTAMPSPGLQVLGGITFSLVPPLAALAIVKRELLYLCDVDIPSWLMPIVGLLFCVVFAIVRVQYAEHQLRQRASAFGARLPPRVRGRLPGNIDVLKRLLDSWRYGYPGSLSNLSNVIGGILNVIVVGDDITDKLAETGYVADFAPLWNHVVMTACPEHIQIILASDFQNYVKGSDAETRINMHSLLTSVIRENLPRGYGFCARYGHL